MTINWNKHIILNIAIKDRNYKAEAIVYMSHDDDDGADMDGNRGTNKCFIDEIEIVSVQDEQGKEIPLTIAIETAYNDALDTADLEPDENEEEEEEL